MSRLGCGRRNGADELSIHRCESALDIMALFYVSMQIKVAIECFNGQCKLYQDERSSSLVGTETNVISEACSDLEISIKIK